MPIAISSHLPPLMDQETSSRIPMAKAAKIIRNSVHTFLQNYQYFTSISAILALPFSISILLSQSLLIFSSNSLLPTIYTRLTTLFLAAGFFSPDSSDFFSSLCLKLSQTISSSISTLPFTLTFLLITKSSVIQFLNHPKKPSFPSSFSSVFPSVFSIFNPLFLTYICNSFLILSANATVFSILFFTFNFLESFGFSSSSSSPTFFLFLSAAGAVLYSIILANALTICNLSLVLSGIERSGGYLAILKSCVLIRGRASTALSLALPANLAMAGIEALFQYRIVRAYHSGETESPSTLLLGLEGLLIAYLYSILVVVDTIVSCIFYKSCNSSSLMDQEIDGFAYRIAIAEGKDGGGYVNLKVLEDLP